MKYILDTHCHSIASVHAYSTITENITYAHKIGLQLIAITDHAPSMPRGTSPSYFNNLTVLPRYIEGIEVLRGVELNILDSEGNIDLSENILKKLDITIASMHSICIKPMSKEENTQAYINAMKNPYITIIGHPGAPEYPFDIYSFVREAKNTNTVIEINNASLLPDSIRYGSEPIILNLLKECKKQSVPIILGSDAHYHLYIGNFDMAQKIIDEIEMPSELILNTSVELFKKTVKTINKL